MTARALRLLTVASAVFAVVCAVIAVRDEFASRKVR